MSIFDVSLQCWWCRHGQAALVALVLFLVNSDVIFQQLGAVEVLSTLLAREIFFQGANSFPLKVCLGLRNELGIITTRSSKDKCSTGSNNHLRLTDLFRWYSFNWIGQKILMILHPSLPPSSFWSMLFIGGRMDVFWVLFIIFLSSYLSAFFYLVYL